MTWTEIATGSDRIRYRKREGQHARPSAAYDLEYWHEGRQEWRTLRNTTSRDHFALGIAAGLDMARRGVQEELAL